MDAPEQEQHPEKEQHPLAAYFGLPSLWALGFPVPAIVVTLATGSVRWGLLAILLTTALVLAVRAMRR